MRDALFVVVVIETVINKAISFQLCAAPMNKLVQENSVAVQAPIFNGALVQVNLSLKRLEPTGRI
jgi:hypothetical protein